MIFAAATFYSFGKAFLWPTMLGVAGERYPQCGSVAMGALGAAGMLCVGQIAGTTDWNTARVRDEPQPRTNCTRHLQSIRFTRHDEIMGIRIP